MPSPAVLQDPLAARRAVPVDAPDALARRELRRQIADLERRHSDVVLSAFPRWSVGGVEPVAPRRRAASPGARLLKLGELEALRDDLAERLAQAQAALGRIGVEQERARERLERMLREPHRHKFVRVANAELGEGGCGVWQVRPRLGLVGMLAGWWEVKLSSGCPSGERRGRRRGPGASCGRVMHAIN